MKSRHKSLFYFISVYLFFSLILVSCNKDDVIEIKNPNDGKIERPVTSKSSPYISIVFEYTPAPGQFINDFGSIIFDEKI